MGHHKVLQKITHIKHARTNLCYETYIWNDIKLYRTASKYLPTLK